MPKQRKLVAAVIYNRLHEGMPLGIDATIRFATGNYTKPLTESELDDRLALQHAHQRRPAAGADQQPRPRRDRGRRPPGQERLPLLREQAGHLRRARLLHDRSRIRSRRRRLQRGARSERRQRAEHLLGNSDAAAGGARPPGRRTRARRRCRTRRWPSSGWRSEWSYEAIEVAPEDFEARVRAMRRRGLRRRQRHRPPQGGGAGAGRRAAATARARSAPPTR